MNDTCWSFVSIVIAIAAIWKIECISEEFIRSILVLESARFMLVPTECSGNFITTTSGLGEKEGKTKTKTQFLSIGIYRISLIDNSLRSLIL